MLFEKINANQTHFTSTRTSIPEYILSRHIH